MDTLQSILGSPSKGTESNHMVWLLCVRDHAAVVVAREELVTRPDIGYSKLRGKKLLEDFQCLGHGNAGLELVKG